MMMSSPDPDVVRWGLHTLMDVCAISNAGSSCSVTHYERETGTIEYVREGYNSVSPTNNVENDAVIASALQEELSRIAAAEASGIYDHEEDAILAQDWVGDHVSCFPCEKLDGDEVRIHHVKDDMDSDNFLKKEDDHSNKEKVEGAGDIFIPLSSSGDTENCSSSEDFQCWSNIADEYCLDGEVGKRLNTMASIPHVPKINGQIPAEDEEMSDHERLLDRLQVYDLVENKIAGDGNCQFRSLSDQLYRSSDHHKYVREQVVYQLKCHPEIYEGCVPMPYEEYLKRMSKSGEWGDHVTLQAAADVYGVKIFMITSFKDTCYIEILPHVQKSNRIIFLSFWAEVHYNSIYPQGELPSLKKKKKWWFGL